MEIKDKSGEKGFFRREFEKREPVGIYGRSWNSPDEGTIAFPFNS